MRIFTTAIFAALLLGFACSANAADGKTVYNGKCRVCHAEDGTGNAGMAKLKKLDPVLLNLTTEKNTRKSDADIQKVIREGQGAMNAIPADKLNDDDLKAAIAHIRTLQSAKK